MEMIQMIFIAVKKKEPNEKKNWISNENLLI